jgi:hypothetical protein
MIEDSEKSFGDADLSDLTVEIELISLYYIILGYDPSFL